MSGTPPSGTRAGLIICTEIRAADASQCSKYSRLLSFSNKPTSMPTNRRGGGTTTAGDKAGLVAGSQSHIAPTMTRPVSRLVAAAAATTGALPPLNTIADGGAPSIKPAKSGKFWASCSMGDNAVPKSPQSVECTGNTACGHLLVWLCSATTAMPSPDRRPAGPSLAA
jgi:hypothetical protein